MRAAIDPDVAYPDTFVYDGATWEIQATTNWGIKGKVYFGVAIKLVAG